MTFDELIKEIKFEVDFGGVKLAPAIVQDADKGDVLMMAWMNEEALRRTVECDEMVFWSVAARNTGTRVTPAGT